MLERTPHHTFFKSEYFAEDKDDDWNLVTICRGCHYLIHHGGGTLEKSQKGRKLEEMGKLIAFNRYEGKYKDKLEKILKAKRMWQK